MENHENQLVSKEEFEKLLERVQKLEEAQANFVKIENISRVLDDELHKESRARGY